MTSIVEYLHFSTCHVGCLILRVFDHIKYDAAVSTSIDLPFNTEFVIFIFSLGEDITSSLFDGLVKIKFAVLNFPPRAYSRGVEVSPSRCCFPIKQELPSVLLFFCREGVLCVG